MSSVFVPPRPDQWEGPKDRGGFTPPALDSWDGPKKQTLPDGRGSDIGVPSRASDLLPAPDQAVQQATTAARAIVDVATRPGPAPPPLPYELQTPAQTTISSPD